MALPSAFHLSGLSAAYIFTFDLPVGPDRWLDERAFVRLLNLSSASYQTDDDTLLIRGSDAPHIIQAYRDDMYAVRFKRAALSQRKTTILQLPRQSSVGLSGGASQVVRADEELPVEICCTLNEMGVGSLVIWLEFIPEIMFDLETLVLLRNPRLTTTQVDWTIGKTAKRYRLTGRRSIEELARFVVICLFCQLSLGRWVDSIRRRIDSEPLAELHEALCRRTASPLQPSSRMESYPCFFSDLKNSKASNDEIAAWARQHAPEIRGLLTGDRNWARKRATLAEEFLKTQSFSTRDSILWYTHPATSLKIYSSQMDTSILTSKVLLVFEVEYLLLMKQFAYRVIRNLSSLAAKRRGSIPLRQVARLRDQEMRRLDEYYNLDVLQKDTTVNRLKQFHDMFRVGEVVAIATHKLESVNVFLNTEFQGASIRRTLALSIIFGVLGAGKLLFAFLQAWSHDPDSGIGLSSQIAVTVCGMAVVGLVIGLVFGRPRIR